MRALRFLFEISPFPMNVRQDLKDLTLWCCLFLAPALAVQAQVGTTKELRGSRIMVRAEILGGKLQEHYFAKREGAWVEIANVPAGEGIGPVQVTPPDQ